jgi:hypothetical protein
MANIFYNPEKFGLKLVASEDFCSHDFEFDIIAVWRDVKSNKFYYASDSGCSCPIPFERYDGIRALNPLNKRTWSEFSRFVETYNKSDDGVSAHSRFDFLARVKYSYDNARRP